MTLAFVALRSPRYISTALTAQASTLPGTIQAPMATDSPPIKQLQNGNTPKTKDSAKGTVPPKQQQPIKDSAKGPVPPKQQQSTNDRHEAIAVLAELEAAIRKASKYAHTYADFGKILDQKSALELQISDKNTEIMTKDARIAFLEAHKAENMEDYEKRYTEWANEKTVLEQQVEDAKADAAERKKTALMDQENKHKKEIAKLKKELATEKTKSGSLAQKLETSVGSETRLQQQLDLAKTTLKEWENKLSVLKDIDLGKLLVESHTHVICSPLLR